MLSKEEYFKQLARRLLLEYESLLFELNNLSCFGKTEFAADQEANEIVRETADLSLREYMCLAESDFDGAYEEYKEYMSAYGQEEV